MECFFNIFLYNKFIVVWLDFFWFGFSLFYSFIFVIFKFFGVFDIWFIFFKKFFLVLIKFVVDGLMVIM